MTSIGSVASYHPQSPRDLLQSELTAEVSSGTISSSDKTALSSALDDIDTALKADASSGSKPASPEDMQSKINDLISAEVKSGKLTSDQATELKNIFAKAMPQHGPGSGQPGGPGAPGGADQTDTSGTSPSDASSLLQQFLKLIQDSQGATGYGSSGDAQKTISSLLMSFQA
jgi:hypothetical protein